jgi:hypothetical protein
MSSRSVRGLFLAGGCAAVFFFWMTPRAVQADSVTGHADVIYSRSDFVSEDFTGNESNTQSRTLIQQYSLAADKFVLPNLRLFASGIFQQSGSDSVTDGERTSTTTVMKRPFLDMSLRSFPLSAGVNYSKVSTETRIAGLPRNPVYSEAYNGFFGWKPAELPSLDIMVNRTNNYDSSRTIVNTVNDQITVQSHYYPVKTLQLRYFGSTTEQKDLLTGSDTKTTGNDGRIDYGDRFLRNRVLFTVSEEYRYSTLESAKVSALGNVDVRVFAINGLSLNTFDSLGQSHVPLADAQFLIDNSFTTPRNNSNNIGSALYPLDTTPRNLGLQFATASEVNRLDVWVYSVHNVNNPDTTQDYLTAAVAGAFSWTVYTSTDNVTWVLHQTAVTAAYTPSPGTLGGGRFEITFPGVKTQYVKVVVTPILPTAAGNEGSSFPGVYVTELQTFLSTSSSLVTGRQTEKMQTTNVTTKVSILERPYLNYDFSYFQVQSESLQSTDRRSTMSNGLTLSHRFNTVFSGYAGAQRIDAKTTDPNGNLLTYQYNVSVMAVPLPTLQHSLSYSYVEQTAANGTGRSRSVYMTNNADLYKGVSAYLNAGKSWATDTKHQSLNSTQYSYGVSLVPLKTLSITGSSVYSKTDLYYSRSEVLSIAYTPFATMFLNASWTTIDQSSHHDRLQNYNASWSPFPGGDLLLNIAYLETLQLQYNTLQKTLQESARWNINKRTYAQASYADSVETSDLQRTTIRTFSAQLSLAF